ncbi:hypothetical protein [Thermococcus waiotapuensis]|uniref:Uncharacterized protein n=1 Tax=Thermococcus waiotapuensis TaxID=90909 RepID=A0AAE4T471_9EURY|nr:hypothetical protein [Thermococcus waiotapuensis]MDV3104573.1 hypothetical protein [Thermococcus waiotapuensis]
MRRVEYILFGLFVFLIFGSQLSAGTKPAVDTALPSWMAPNNFQNPTKMVTPAAMWPGYGGGSNVAVIHYVRDEDENYYHTDTAMDILMGILCITGTPIIMALWEILYGHAITCSKGKQSVITVTLPRFLPLLK